MMKKLNWLFLAIGLTGFSSLAAANTEAIEAGKALHQDGNCMSCHTEKGYHPSKTTSFPKLVAQVDACSTNFELGWFEDEVEAVAHYLNENFYKFK